MAEDGFTTAEIAAELGVAAHVIRCDIRAASDDDRYNDRRIKRSERVAVAHALKASGLSDDEISAELGVARKTVRGYLGPLRGGNWAKSASRVVKQELARHRRRAAMELRDAGSRLRVPKCGCRLGELAKSATESRDGRQFACAGQNNVGQKDDHHAMLLRRGQRLFERHLAKNVRDRLRGLPDTFDAERFGDDRLLAAMIEAGFITTSDERRCSLTTKGGQLRAARVGKPFCRDIADRLLCEVVERAQAINDADGPVFVQSVRVFGSYLDSSKDELGDLDLAVDVRCRRQTGLGCRALFRAHDDALVFLRNRSRYISLCTSSTLDALGVPWREVLAWDDGRGLAVALPWAQLAS